MSLRSEVVRIVNELLGNGKKISQLPDASSLSGSEYFEVAQLGESRKVLASAIIGGGAIVYFRGAYDASGDAYPATGGNGPAGTPAAGDEWYVSVSGDIDVEGLGVITVYPGALLKSLITTPGQTPSNWKVTQ